MLCHHKEPTMFTAFVFSVAYIFIGMGHAGSYQQRYVVDRPYSWTPLHSWFIWPLYVVANRERSFIVYAAIILAFAYWIV